MSKRFYFASRRGNVGPASVLVCEPGWPSHALAPRTDLANHSPDGFQWGYAGSGPAQLALALCADATGDNALALRVYQDFKFEALVSEDRDEWRIDADEIRAACARLDSTGPDAPTAGESECPSTL